VTNPIFQTDELLQQFLHTVIHMHCHSKWRHRTH